LNSAVLEPTFNTISPIASRVDVYGGYYKIGRIVIGHLHFGQLLEYDGGQASTMPLPYNSKFVVPLLMYDTSDSDNTYIVGYIGTDGRVIYNGSKGHVYSTSFVYVSAS
jgi:hypothetical protein